ncbi:hypothetical protein CMQ_7112 [Grosmannia clavigera kw1407]|uniref:Uncharacterized protein n=1 Tax=Grosmannia clavigera (strain kw1407 / UAMH 11150) TaxID=655863 RepID=F0XQI1_GROCL|nr:uncharacterized protein CMQ_7112 [Grosmannia clavigera kw1407]EFX00110.1 hypothetical protein CMQ_7112 [Grosmannia clavigera kw1407]
MRLCVPAASLDIEGFAVHRLQSKMQYADFSNESTIETIYCSELEDHIVKMTGAKNVRVLDYQLRRKSPSFPYFQGKLPPRPQPSLVAHVDLTPETAENIVRELYKDTAEQILRSRYQIITWYWLPDHQTDEILVFNAFDSEALSSSPCAHGAFPLPGEHGDAPARESIDARLLVMYADIKYPAPQPQSI